MIEVKLNKEIQNYHESVFMGLSLRQTLCSALAVGTAVGVHYLLSPYLNGELVSWLSLLGAIPFAFLGFVRYNGMPAEQLFIVWVRCKLLEPRELVCIPTNLYFEAMKIKSKRERRKKR